MKARPRISGVVPGEARRTYAGRMRDAAPFDLAVAAPMEMANPPVPCPGFQGLRYLTATELAAFSRVFP